MTLDASILARLYGRHPARVMPYDDLRAGLADAVRRGDVFVNRDGPLELYGYTSACAFDRRWDLFSLIARGLVLDREAGRVVATPFPKFFNFDEGAFLDAPGLALPGGPFEATEKVDGSLGIVFHHAGHWRVTTRGHLGSEQGRWATAHLARHVTTGALTPGETYLVEIVYAGNRVVVPYAFEGLVLLGGYDAAGDELPRDALTRAAGAAGLRLVESASFDSVDELLAAARGLGRDREGFVLRFAGGLRVKVKGAEYCRVHRLICRCTPLAVWEMMTNGDDLDRVRRDLPEEMTGDFDAIRRLLEARLATLVGEVRAAVDAAAHLADADVGRLVQDEAAALTPWQRRFLFMARKGRFLEHVHAPGAAREKAFRQIRPDGNALPGYAPSEAAARFAAESEEG